MSEAGFDASRGDHWLLIFCAVIVLGYGLWASWRWNRKSKRSRLRNRMAQRFGQRFGVCSRIGPGVRPRKGHKRVRLRRAGSRRVGTFESKAPRVEGADPRAEGAKAEAQDFVGLPFSVQLEEPKAAMRSRNRFLN